MPGWLWWIVWGALGLAALATYSIILSGLVNKAKRLASRLEKVSSAAEKLDEAARLLDRSN